MPDFSAHRKPWKSSPQGGLDKKLVDVKQDIKAVKDRDETDVTRKEFRAMKQNKRDIKAEIRAEVAKERAAMKKN